MLWLILHYRICTSIIITEYPSILITILVLSTSLPSSNPIYVSPSDISISDSASSNILPVTNTELENLSGTLLLSLTYNVPLLPPSLPSFVPTCI